MRKLIRKVAILAALGLAAPTWAQTATGEAKDAQDTATEKKAETKRAARNKKPGGETAKDQAKDAQDATTAKTAKAKKKGRKAARKTKKAPREMPRISAPTVATRGRDLDDEAAPPHPDPLPRSAALRGGEGDPRLAPEHASPPRWRGRSAARSRARESSAGAREIRGSLPSTRVLRGGEEIPIRTLPDGDRRPPRQRFPSPPAPAGGEGQGEGGAWAGAQRAPRR